MANVCLRPYGCRSSISALAQVAANPILNGFHRLAVGIDEESFTGHLSFEFTKGRVEGTKSARSMLPQ